MKFSENEKDFIRELVNFDFSQTNIGWSLLLDSKKYFYEDEIALFMSRQWGNGKYKLYYLNDDADKKKNRNLLYKYVEIFQLINKLNENRLITIIPDRGQKSNAVFLSNYGKDTDVIVSITLSRPNQIYTFDINQNEKIEAINGQWTKGSENITEKESISFDNNTLPIEDFLYGIIYISPELVDLKEAEFQTYEEKTLNIALDSLKETRESVELARKSLEETTKSVNFAKQSVKIAELSLNTAKRSNCIANWAIGISFVTALGSIGVSIWAENNPDNVTIQNPPDDVIKTSAKDVSKDINNNIDIKFEEAKKLLYLNKSKNKAK